jgi:uncharacterized repeat protein (TIGR01451 family)
VRATTGHDRPPLGKIPHCVRNEGINLKQEVPSDLEQLNQAGWNYTRKISMLSNLRMLGVAMSLSLLMLGNPAHLAAVDFAAGTGYPVGTSPSGVVVADFNGDGKPDIAVANTGSSTVSILLGNGDGTFQTAMNFNAGNNPTTVAVGDFNGDGKLDLALFQPGDLQSSQAGSVSILLGNGDGTFQAPKTLALGPAATVIAVADFNLDQKSDLAVFNTASVGIYIGNGDGTFHPVIGVSTPAADGIAMVVADFNGDSKPDLAVTYTSTIQSSGLDILLGNGDGTFSFGFTLAIPREFSNLSPAFTTINSVGTADLNHDGKVDLLIGSTGPGFDCPHSLCTRKITKFSAFLGNGDGSFQGEQIVASATVQTETATHTSSGSTIDRLILGDFNGDGKADLGYRMTTVAPIGALAPPPSFEILLGKADGTFSGPLTSGLQNVDPFAGSIAEAQDLNADKLTDLIAVSTANDIEVLLNTGPSSGADLAILSSSASPEPVGVGNDLTYVAHVLNQGPKDATGVMFTDTLPNNVNFVSATASPGSCVQANGMVSCNVGALASSAEFAVNIVVTPTVAGTIMNTLNVTANETDPVPANNTATQTTTALPIFTLTIAKTGNGSGTVATSDGRINCGTTCTASYLSGTVINVRETADANSVFTGWSGACTGTGSCAVTLSADMTVTATFNPPAPDFTVVPASTAFTAQTGAQVTDVLTLTGQNNFSGQVNLNCVVTGPSPMPACNVSPSPVTLGSSPGSSTLTITAPATLAAFGLPRNDGNRTTFALDFSFFALLLAGIGLWLGDFKKRQRLSLLLGCGVLILFGVLAGCAAGSSTSPPTPQNYTVTVNATSGSLQHSTKVTITVE